MCIDLFVLFLPLGIVQKLLYLSKNFAEELSLPSDTFCGNDADEYMDELLFYPDRSSGLLVKV